MLLLVLNWHLELVEGENDTCNFWAYLDAVEGAPASWGRRRPLWIRVQLEVAGCHICRDGRGSKTSHSLFFSGSYTANKLSRPDPAANAYILPQLNCKPAHWLCTPLYIVSLLLFYRCSLITCYFDFLFLVIFVFKLHCCLAARK
jgi:hypothetical protein